VTKFKPVAGDVAWSAIVETDKLPADVAPVEGLVTPETTTLSEPVPLTLTGVSTVATWEFTS
jgi:hypothetical protein